MHLPGISIVMPLLNQRAFLEESVRSVFEQPLERIELVVMDGGSSDGSLPLLAELAGRYDGRLRWFSAPDSGPAQALNRAVSLARHELLGWLPADDLYTSGAVRRAVEALAEQPQWQLVYGEGEHVDVAGRSLGRYPTLPPDTPLAAFADGCFVCQPTLFMRRAVWLEAGGVDESLRASFDFELWLRLFRRYAGRIGFIDQVQAQSRLHAGGITLRERQRVALEGLQVLHRHLGRAPAHWLLTLFEERLHQHPFEAELSDLREQLPRLVEQASGWLDDEARTTLGAWLDGHAGLRFGGPHWAIEVDADGWVRPSARVALRDPPGACKGLRLRGRNAHPRGELLHIELLAPHGASSSLEVPGGACFEMHLPLQTHFESERAVWLLRSGPGFVPLALEPGSDDARELAFLLEGLDFLD
jgi:glycosyltransferase involved in cell wall biosynthesis